MIEKVLVVDDELPLLCLQADILKRQGKEVVLAESGARAIQLLENETFDLVITDLKMPGKTGLDVLRFIKERSISTLVILSTAHGTIDSAVEAMKLGAFHYLIKPFTPEALESILEKGEEHLRLKLENGFYKEHGNSDLVAESPAMKKIVADLEKIAKSQASVFITGESGTGKEVIAGVIHRLSQRSQSPFIKINCAAMADNLLESEFFGHEKGSFTGAHSRKMGRFELAHQGTILLDEVTEIPLSLQPKLLRAIQEQEFERVGGTKVLKVNVRFLATSNRDMKEAIKDKVFREDLFYRLNVVPIQIPALKERKEDILPLARSFLQKFCLENHKDLKHFTPDAEQKLLDYAWPGNVRELANTIERTVVLEAGDCIGGEQLKLETGSVGTYQGSTLAELEKQHILKIYNEHEQNGTKAAAILGISTRTLRNKLKEYRSVFSGD